MIVRLAQADMAEAVTVDRSRSFSQEKNQDGD
jgi:hypothetical protein